MSLFLLILQIIGMTLLGILALFLSVLALVLFVPIRYRIRADYQGKFQADAGIFWLLHFISARILYGENGMEASLRILGMRYRKPKRAPKKNRKESGEVSEEIPTDADYTMEGFEEPKSLAAGEEDVASERERGFFCRLREYLHRVFDFVLHLKEKVQGFFFKMKRGYENLTHYVDFFTDEKMQEALKHALSLVLDALRRIRPCKLKGRLHFGFEDPATTGKLLVFLSLLYPCIAGRIEVVPEFGEAVVEGDLFLQGRVFLIELLVIGWKLYFSKDIRIMMKQLKRED